MITSSGKHIQIIERRYCSKCNVFTDQVCHKIRYQQSDEQPDMLLKTCSWVCPVCLTGREEVRVQPLPGDKLKIINRLLKMNEDYAIQSMNISSQPEKLVVEITVKE